jgi:hypothetical protein
MKKVVTLLILAFAILSAGVVTYRAVAKPRIIVPQSEPCIGINCWPVDLPMKHRPSHRETLPPVW